MKLKSRTPRGRCIELGLKGIGCSWQELQARNLSAPSQPASLAERPMNDRVGGTGRQPLNPFKERKNLRIEENICLTERLTPSPGALPLLGIIRITAQCQALGLGLLGRDANAHGTGKANVWEDSAQRDEKSGLRRFIQSENMKHDESSGKI